MPHVRTPRPARAFTLVELLVVIGIIALLISILLPALNAAKSQAHTLKCAANQRTLGQTLHQYANDYKGLIPRDYSHGQQRNIFWGEAFAKYLNRPLPHIPGPSSSSRDRQLAPEFAKIGAYQCPVHPNDRQPVDYVCNGWDKYSLTGRTQGVFNVVKFKRNSEVIFLTEGHKNALVDDFAYHDVWDPPHLPTAPVGGRRVLDDNRHRGKINCVFLDGHVETRLFKHLKETDFRMREFAK